MAVICILYYKPFYINIVNTKLFISEKELSNNVLIIFHLLTAVLQQPNCHEISTKNYTLLVQAVPGREGSEINLLL